MVDLKLNAIVAHRIEISPSLIILRICPDGWELPDFIGGQFAVLGLPDSSPRCSLSDDEPDAPTGKLIRRAYSISSSSKTKEYIEFYITLVRSGKLTPRLFHLKEGDKDFLNQKYTGTFTLDMVPDNAHTIFMGTGTGLAPYMSMIRSSLQANSDNKTVIVHGARHSWDLGYRSELSTLATICRNLTYLPVITRPQLEHVKWGGSTGYLQDIWVNGTVAKIADFKPTAENSHIFLCGNPSMVDTLQEILESEGFTEHTRKISGNIHVERYW